MVEASVSYYKAQKTIEAEICEDDENRKYKHKDELSRENSLSGHC